MATDPWAQLAAAMSEQPMIRPDKRKARQEEVRLVKGQRQVQVKAHVRRSKGGKPVQVRWHWATRPKAAPKPAELGALIDPKDVLQWHDVPGPVPEGAVRLWRADLGESLGEVHQGMHFAAEPGGAAAYLENPGYGGPNLHAVDVAPGTVYRADGARYRQALLEEVWAGMTAEERERWGDDAEALMDSDFGRGHLHEAMDNDNIEGPLRRRGYDWIVFEDSYPEDTVTWRALRPMPIVQEARVASTRPDIIERARAMVSARWDEDDVDLDELDEILERENRPTQTALALMDLVPEYHAIDRVDTSRNERFLMNMVNTEIATMASHTELRKARIKVKQYMRGGKLVQGYDQTRTDAQKRAVAARRQAAEEQAKAKAKPDPTPKAKAKRSGGRRPAGGAPPRREGKVPPEERTPQDGVRGTPAARFTGRGPSGGRKVHDEPMPKLPEGFNNLPKDERARLTARWSDVRRELNARIPVQGYDRGSVVGAMNDARDHLSHLVEQGWIAEGNHDRATMIVDRLGEALVDTGVDAKDAAYVLEDTVRKLAHQEHESIRRTLGDHGVRHLSHNIEAMNGVFDALEQGGMKITSQDRLAGILVQVNHDMGYTIPAIARGGFKVKDNYHPQAGAELFEQQTQGHAAWGRVLGDRLGRMDDWIRNHSGTEVDWRRDPVGSAVRVADNTHLFHDKMPELLFNHPGAMEAMVKIALLQHAADARAPGKGKVDLGPLKEAMKANLGDVPEPQRSALEQAIGEIGPMTPKFLASRLAGRDASWSYDKKDNNLTVDVEQSPLRGVIGRVFGQDKADQQFIKLLQDYGVTDPDPSKPVTLGKEGEGKLTLKWTPPKSKAQGIEQKYQATARRVLREWRRVQDLPEGSREHTAAHAAFMGKLEKAARALMGGLADGERSGGGWAWMRAMRTWISDLAKARRRETESELEAAGQLGLFGGGAPARQVRVKPHVRRSKTGKASAVKGHQRTVEATEATRVKPHEAFRARKKQIDQWMEEHAGHAATVHVLERELERRAERRKAKGWTPAPAAPAPKNDGWSPEQVASVQEADKFGDAAVLEAVQAIQRAKEAGEEALPPDAGPHPDLYGDGYVYDGYAHKKAVETAEAFATANTRNEWERDLALWSPGFRAYASALYRAGGFQTRGVWSTPVGDMTGEIRRRLEPTILRAFRPSAGDAPLGKREFESWLKALVPGATVSVTKDMYAREWDGKVTLESEQYPLAQSQTSRKGDAWGPLARDVAMWVAERRAKEAAADLPIQWPRVPGLFDSAYDRIAYTEGVADTNQARMSDLQRAAEQRIDESIEAHYQIAQQVDQVFRGTSFKNVAQARKVLPDGWALHAGQHGDGGYRVSLSVPGPHGHHSFEASMYRQPDQDSYYKGEAGTAAEAVWQDVGTGAFTSFVLGENTLVDGRWTSVEDGGASFRAWAAKLRSEGHRLPSGMPYLHVPTGLTDENGRSLPLDAASVPLPYEGKPMDRAMLDRGYQSWAASVARHADVEPPAPEQAEAFVREHTASRSGRLRANSPLRKARLTLLVKASTKPRLPKVGLQGKAGKAGKAPAGKSEGGLHPEVTEGMYCRFHAPGGKVRHGRIDGRGTKGCTIIDSDTGEAHKIPFGYFAVTAAPKE